MPIYRNGKKITKIMRNGKEISKVYRGGKLVYQNKVASGTVLWKGNSTGGNLTLSHPLNTMPNGIKIYFASGSCSGSVSGSSDDGYTSFSASTYGSVNLSASTLSVPVNPSWVNKSLGISAHGGSLSGSGSRCSVSGSTSGSVSGTVGVTKKSNTVVNISGLGISGSISGSWYLEYNPPMPGSNGGYTSGNNQSGSIYISGSAYVTKIVAY